MKTIRDFNPKNKVILIRADFNVPLKDGQVEDDFRIRASLPTINYLLENGAKKIILISHLGRPEGKIDLKYSLSPVADALRKLLPDQKIAFYSLPQKGEDILSHSDCNIILLENLRFDPGEEGNSNDFIKQIADSAGAEIFVQDGFAVTHRAHASTDAITKILPTYAGLLVEKEVQNLTKIIQDPEKPLLLIIGGAKVEDKQPLIEKFLPLADHIVVGGKIAADGYTSKNPKIYVAEDFDENNTHEKLDVGPISTTKIANLIKDSRTIIWNGLLGYAEDPAYATSSTIVAELMGEKTDATTIVCGGDTTGFVQSLLETHPDLHYSLISTGGGAALEFLLDQNLPGLKAIR